MVGVAAAVVVAEVEVARAQEEVVENNYSRLWKHILIHSCTKLIASNASTSDYTGYRSP